MNVQAPQATEAARAGIETARAEHVAALNDRDVEAWVAGFAGDGVQMPPNFPANVGSDAIRAWAEAFLAPFDQVQFRLAPGEVNVLNPDWAFETGTWEIALVPQGGGGSIQDAGKYITIYQRRSDATWVMARDIWNSSNPLPG